MVMILSMSRFFGFRVMHLFLVVMYGFLMMHCFDRMPEPFGMSILVGFPVRMVLRPFGMVLVHPAGIVLMPPVSLVPTVIGTVGAPASGVRQLSPDVGMVLHEGLQIGVLFSESLVVNQAGIPLELRLQCGTLIEKCVQAFFLVLGRRDRRRHRRGLLRAAQLLRSRRGRSGAQRSRQGRSRHPDGRGTHAVEGGPVLQRRPGPAEHGEGGSRLQACAEKFPSVVVAGHELPPGGFEL